VARALLVFVDGIGVGRPGAHNPFDGAPVRVLAPLAGGEGDPRVAAGSIDATLGHPGLPQSATGQAALFTGEDAVAVAGGHREGLPTRAVGELLGRSSVLAAARRRGKSAAFLNAFDAGHAGRLARVASGEEPPPARRERGRGRPSASALAALAGGGRLRTLDDARAGRAVPFDFTGEVLRAHGLDAPARSLDDAGRTLAAAAAEVDLALFETFLTDKAGHAQDMAWARHEIARLERFLAALLDAIDPREQLVVVTSDHGNLEDLSTRTHTRAPVPLLAFGRGARAFVDGARSLLDVAPRLISALDA
jgi:2,3-bisphosphoglycerate-independent phosphoglycerate mutase